MGSSQCFGSKKKTSNTQEEEEEEELSVQMDAG